MVAEICAIKKVHENGRIVIPKDIRKILDISQGDDLIVTLKNGVIVLEKTEKQKNNLYRVCGRMRFYSAVKKDNGENKMEMKIAPIIKCIDCRYFIRNYPLNEYKYRLKG